jgi:hypothetical protein
MSDYGTPHINRLEGVPGVFRIWTDDGDQKTSRLVTASDLIAFRAKIGEMLTADRVEQEKATGTWMCPSEKGKAR